MEKKYYIKPVKVQNGEICALCQEVYHGINKIIGMYLYASFCARNRQTEPVISHDFEERKEEALEYLSEELGKCRI